MRCSSLASINEFRKQSVKPPLETIHTSQRGRFLPLQLAAFHSCKELQSLALFEFIPKCPSNAHPFACDILEGFSIRRALFYCVHQRH
jgi:hypothetical protein